ncbi:hypothetical protein PGB90_005258 [Kerria lacca]
MVESVASKCGSKIRRIVDKDKVSRSGVSISASAATAVTSVKSVTKLKNENIRVEKRNNEHSAVLLSRRRRHKTVHFIESPMNDFGIADSRNFNDKAVLRYTNNSRGSVVSLPDEFDNHVQQLFTFIGTVLSSWDNSSDTEDETIACQTTTTSSTSVSISVNHSSTTTISRNSKCAATSVGTTRTKKRQRDILHFLLYSSQSEFNIDENIGCHIYRHRHWKMASGTCNALFLKKAFN